MFITTTTPESWLGYNRGALVATFPGRWAAEAALEARLVEAISPTHDGAKAVTR